MSPRLIVQLFLTARFPSRSKEKARLLAAKASHAVPTIHIWNAPHTHQKSSPTPPPKLPSHFFVFRQGGGCFCSLFSFCLSASWLPKHQCCFPPPSPLWLPCCQTQLVEGTSSNLYVWPGSFGRGQGPSAGMLSGLLVQEGCFGCPSCSWLVSIQFSACYQNRTMPCK